MSETEKMQSQPKHPAELMHEDMIELLKRILSRVEKAPEVDREVFSAIESVADVAVELYKSVPADEGMDILRKMIAAHRAITSRAKSSDILEAAQGLNTSFKLLEAIGEICEFKQFAQ